MTRRLSYFSAALLIVALGGLSACSDGGNGSPSDTQTPPPSGVISYVELVALGCVQNSVCTGDAINHCFSFLADDDVVSLPQAYYDAIKHVSECHKTADSCDAHNACKTAFAESITQDETCPDGPPDQEVFCQNDTSYWCLGGGGAKANRVIDLEKFAMTCSADGQWPMDVDATDCNTESGSYCDGDYMVDCHSGKTASWDCKRIDTDFECVATESNQRCGIAESKGGCPDNNYNNEWESGRCNDSVAVICVAGKTIEIDCASFMGATCKESKLNEYNAFCVVDGVTPQ